MVVFRVGLFVNLLFLFVIEYGKVVGFVIFMVNLSDVFVLIKFRIFLIIKNMNFFCRKDETIKYVIEIVLFILYIF